MTPRRNDLWGRFGKRGYLGVLLKSRLALTPYDLEARRHGGPGLHESHHNRHWPRDRYILSNPDLRFDQ